MKRYIQKKNIFKWMEKYTGLKEYYCQVKCVPVFVWCKNKLL